ncbi:MFS transporter [Allostreptomyces psammosilenae]|uniref:MFS transporter n=1 Tax=Allostreptomyces psammosilenae TaxID=1892865 RepID=UPI001FE3294A
MAGYVAVARAPHALRLLGGTLTGRLPTAMAALAIVLLIRADGGGYTLAGALSAVYGVGCAIGQPVLGRIVDRRGQTVVMTAAATVSAVGFAVLAVVGADPLWLAVVATAVAGLATPPLEAGLRALWPDVLRGDQRAVHTAYSLDAAAQEVMFTCGPLLVIAAGALVSPSAAVFVTGLIGLAGTLMVVTAAPSRAWRGTPHTGHWLGPLRVGHLRLLFGALLFVGMALGSINVTAVAWAEERGAGDWSGVVLAALALGALIGGLAYGARSWTGDADRRLRILVGLLAIGYLPLAIAPGPVGMTLLAVVGGLFLAPVIACSFVVVDRWAPPGTVTEAFSWVVTAFGVGTALGSAVSGPVGDALGVGPAYLVAAASGTVALLVLLVGGRGSQRAAGVRTEVGPSLPVAGKEGERA